MASVQEYIERRTDGELKGTLFSYCGGIVDIPVDTVLRICRELARRNPDLPDPYELFCDLCRVYC